MKGKLPLYMALALSLSSPYLAPQLVRDREGDVLMRQNDGTYQSVHIGGSGPYSIQEPYPGANWAPVYSDNGDRVGTVQREPDGSMVFYDNRGDRR